MIKIPSVLILKSKSIYIKLLIVISNLVLNIYLLHGQNVSSNDRSVPDKPIVIAHYMTWYQRPEISGSWGFWQVNRPTIDRGYWHFPDQFKEKNHRDISSVYYPVIGPYDSGDSDLCEYHILLAKLAGIDAFVADWYGPDSSLEHPYDNIGFTMMHKTAEKLNFKVLICWEDRSMFPPISRNVTTRPEAIERGKEMIHYLANEWFNSLAYLKLNNHPVLTNFAWGDPGNTIQESRLNSVEWNKILNSIGIRPVFIHDWHKHCLVNEFKDYESVMPWGDIYHGNVDTTPVFWQMAEAAILEKQKFSFLSGVVLPGFDNRGCEGWGTDGAIGITDRRNGEKFRATWDDVMRHNVKFIQIVTWNDFNEGGTIEPVCTGILHKEFPAEGYGYRELETTAEFVGKLKGFKPDNNALRVPERIYFARKMLKQIVLKKYQLPKDCSIASLIQIIDKAREYLLNGNTSECEKILTTVYAIFPDEIKTDPDFLLVNQEK